MNLGLAPIRRKDHRTYDFHRTFGSVGLDTIPREFSFDTSGIFPDQNLDGLSNACTAYTENDIASNDDSCNDQGETIYYDDQLFTYNNTKEIEGVSGQVPVSIMDALKAGTVYGVKKKSETAEQALRHRRAPYFIIKGGFDGLISAMWKKQGGIAVGTPWPDACRSVGHDGIVPAFAAPKTFSAGHCWAAVGVTLVNGEQRIICKPWLGPSYGNKGYCYFSKTQIDDLLSVRGSGAFGQKHAEPEDIKAVRMTLIGYLISRMRLLLESMRAKGQTSIPDLVVAPEPVQAQPEASHPPLLDAFCAAIRDYEGTPGDRNYRNNNPGNARFFSGGYASQYGIVLKDRDGFAIFSDYATGWLYLKNLVRSKIEKHPQWGIREFFYDYAPVSDGNDSEAYAAYVAKRLGVGTDFIIKQLLS